MENQADFSIAPLILLSPLIGFLFQSFLGKFLMNRMGANAGKKVCGTVAVLAVLIPFVVAVVLVQRLGALPADSRSVTVAGIQWIDLASFKASFDILLDPLSLTMTLIVTGVGCLIHLYATGYMADDKDYPRFFTYMNLFIVAMLVLVLASNLAMTFVGWEGVGLCSYLLIGFWYKDHANAKAANKAFIVNRIGDFGFMLGMFLLFCLMATNGAQFGTNGALDFSYLATHGAEILRANPGYATAIALLLFIGACGKSAQFPLYSWLPDAMAGPTPVSALIHAATMVTAGVYLLNRMFPVFAAAPSAGPIIAGIGAFTALFAALIAFGQTDIKKVLAFSTVSQLGFMFVACGAGAYAAGMFHVITHAFFKALLFLGAGAVIHAMAHNQDMRNYGGLRKYLPITFGTVMIGFLAIAGFPLLSGFFSKEAILGAAVGNSDSIIKISGFVALGTAFLTAVYMARLAGLTFFGAERWRTLPAPSGHHSDPPPPAMSEEPDPNHFYLTASEIAERDGHAHDDDHTELGPDHTPHEVPISMWLPLVILAIPSAIAGFLMRDKIADWLYPNGGGIPIHSQEVSWLMPVSGAAAILGICFGLYVYTKGLPDNQGWDFSKWNPLRRLAADQFHYDAEVSTGMSIAGRSLALLMAKGVDPYVIDGGVNATGYAAGGVGLILRKIQSGYVRFYAVVMLLGVVGMLGYIFYVLHAMTTGTGS